MTLNRSLTIVLFFTLIAWGVFFANAYLIDPELAGVFSFFLFYLSLFLGAFGLFGLTSFIIRVRILKDSVFRQLRVSFRQSFFVSLLLVILLILKGFDMVRWWNSAILVLVFVCLELLFILRKKQ
ncbi:MAG: hypothetical protein HYW78_00315 [Parcubacteria group bacterium]|nr:hypothetical protein [Parcubacteria group bacterium]